MAACELDYRLIKEIWTFRENRIAVRFAYEGTTTAAIGSAATGTRTGIRRARLDAPSHREHQRRADKENERRYDWLLGRRPDDRSSLSDLGL